MQQDVSNVSPIKLINDLARRYKINAEYQLEKESGPAHAKVYTIRLRLGEKEYIGMDRSIKLAQRAAAQLALDNHEDLLSKDKSGEETKILQPPTVTLNTWTAQHHIPTRYIMLNEPNISSSHHVSCSDSCKIFYYRLFLGQDYYFDGCGPSHQKARINCAYHALNFIYENEKSILMSLPSTSAQIQPKSSISVMYERAKHLGLSVRIEHNKPLTITFHIGKQYSATGTGSTKHTAKQIAAEKMLEILPMPTTENNKQKHHRKRSNQHKKFIEQKASSSYSLTEQINPITRLYQIARARDIQVEFTESENLSHDKLFHFHVKFDEQTFADGYGKNKQAAKRAAAQNLISKLNSDLLISIDSSIPSSSSAAAPIKSLLKRDENAHREHEKKHVHFNEQELDEHGKKTTNDSSSITIKQQLINACQKLNIHIQYDDHIMAHNNYYETILTLSIDDRILAQFRAHAASLIRAQENISLTAWRTLQQLFDGSIQMPKIETKICSDQVQTPILMPKQ